jgi:hypothetical protein
LTRLLETAVDNYEGRWVSLRPYLLLAGIAFLLNLGLSLSGFYNWNYDGWDHLFFSSHYMNSWFNTWEPGWFGGFSVTTYPPLVTQLIALLAFIVGLEHAYILFSLFLMVLVPIAVFSFCNKFLSRQQATWAGFLSILLPSIYLANYIYGQLPALFALATTIFMGAFLWNYLEQGRFRDGLIASLLMGITAASHHFTFICFVPVMAAVTSLTFLASTKTEVRSFLKRLAFFGVLGVSLALITIYPFWQFLLEAEMQTPIPHISRLNLFTDSLAFLQFFLAPYLLFLLFIPLTAVVAYKYKYLLPLFIIAIFLFILGLGGSTPLPKLIFGHWWQWLTYDRFSLWAGILFLPLLARVIPIDLLELGKRSVRPAISVFLTVVILSMSFLAAYLSSEPLRRSFLPSPPIVDCEPLVEFLDGPDVGQQYRYITLGFCEAQVQKLSTLTQANTLDGGYYTARTLPILRESGIAMIDTIKYFDPELKTLDEILATASSYNLKWVLVNDVYYYDILEKHGFELRLSAEITFDSRFGNVTIWGRDDIPPMTEETKSEKGFSSYLWGIAPLLLVVILLFLLFTRSLKNVFKRLFTMFQIRKKGNS